jgi:PhzF family phenazine biosynthesis protein
MKSLTFRHVDAFTRERYRGNPAVVCVTSEAVAEPLMRQIAAEMNVSETAFLYPVDDTAYHLRWFTPVTEVALCGHATLASAHILWEDGHLPRTEPACFQTLSGELRARALPGEGDWIELDFPSLPSAPGDAPAGLLAALGLSSAHAIVLHENKVVVVLESEQDVQAVKPDFGQLLRLPVRGVMVTAQGSGKGKPDFVSRYFGPAVGINEDPVTGSAHCILAPYWGAKLGKKEMFAYQASARGGFIRIGLSGDRVLLAGQAITISRGQFVD